MSFLNLKIEYEQAQERLRGKKHLLDEALLATVGSLGSQLLAITQGNLSGAVLQTRTGVLLASVTMQAAQFVEGVCQSSVGIDEEDPSWIVGMTHEYGGERWYDIYPVNAKALAFMGSNGEMVFTQHVHHPPAIERSWLRSALAEIEATAVDEIKTTIAEVMAA